MQKHENKGEMYKATRWLDWVVLDEPFRWICSVAYSTKKRGVDKKQVIIAVCVIWVSVGKADHDWW